MKITKKNMTLSGEKRQQAHMKFEVFVLALRHNTGSTFGGRKIKKVDRN